MRARLCLLDQGTQDARVMEGSLGDSSPLQVGLARAAHSGWAWACKVTETRTRERK